MLLVLSLLNKSEPLIPAVFLRKLLKCGPEKESFLRHLPESNSGLPRDPAAVLPEQAASPSTRPGRGRQGTRWVSGSGRPCLLLTGVLQSPDLPSLAGTPGLRVVSRNERPPLASSAGSCSCHSPSRPRHNCACQVSSAPSLLPPCSACHGLSYTVPSAWHTLFLPPVRAARHEKPVQGIFFGKRALSRRSENCDSIIALFTVVILSNLTCGTGLPGSNGGGIICFIL